MLNTNKKISLLPRYVRTLLLSAALISFTINSSIAVAKSSDTPIHFAKGALTSTITGKLKPNENEHWYRFNATSWQYAVINIAPLAGKGSGTSETANVGVLHMPNGTQDGTKGGIIYQGCLPATGDYRLRIARNLMATQGKTAGYTVEIMILPKYASESLCEYL
ncbi:hypothetical protein [Psychrobacter sp. DAB_AL32B]|uniref:hypothetical protein n=1 Tax=Psychrobacter sp. DAB_AL32B TaxID=1028414 RepID=UPI000B7C79D1|nr:hypothetical protein [Psychrobacter sp. DAB_AL32B]OXL20214.1 hypothetical protein CAN34_10755 [Psychrobacter sp. DAB_AL32B]